MQSWGDEFPGGKPQRKRRRLGIVGVVVYEWEEYVGRRNKRDDERNLGEAHIVVGVGEE